MRKRMQTGTSSGRRMGMIVVAAAAVAGGASAGAYGQTAVTWVGTTGDYQAGANWSSGSTPSNAAAEFLQVNNGGTVRVTGGAAEGQFLMLGMNPGDTGSLEISGGTLTLGEMRVGGRETIPDGLGGFTPNGGGTGSVLQTGGTVSVNFSTGTEPPIQSLYVGDAGLGSGNTANGSYTIKNDAVLLSGIANNDSIVIGTGAGTQGAFVQQDTSTVTSTGFVAVGRRGATATYALSGGTLNVGSPDLPAVSGMSLWIADGANADATEGVAGTQGTFTQSGASTVNVKGGVEIGRRGGTGSYTIDSGSLNVTGQIIIAGNGGASAASMLSSTGTFNVGGTADVNIGTNFNVGLSSSSVANTAQGTLNMTGGTIDLTANNAVFAIGNGRGTTGTVDLSAGSITMTGTSALIDVGRNNGNGLLWVHGTGSLTANQVVVNSTNVAGMTREVRLEGGAVDIGTLTGGSVASQATRSVNITGGDVHIGFLSTGNATGSGSSVTHISNNAAPVIDSLELFSGSTFKVSSDLALTSLNNTTPMPNYRFGNATVDVDGGVTFTINGPGNFGSGAARTLTKVGNGTLAVNATQNYVANTVITVNAGTLAINSATTDGNLTINANGTTTFGDSQSIKSLNVADGVTATLTADGSRTLSTGDLNLNSTGTLDLTDNALVINYTSSPLATVVAKLHAAYNNGAWDQPGLTSSTARDRADNATGLGYADTGTQVLVEYTWAGDLNLDGKLDGDDYALIDRQVALNGLNSAGFWKDGDVNYDGTVNAGDYLVIDAAYFYRNGSLAPDILTLREAEFGSEYVGQLLAAIPEPTSLAACGLALLPLARRRRK